MLTKGKYIFMQKYTESYNTLYLFVCFTTTSAFLLVKF